MMEKLQGKKTYILGALGLVVAILNIVGVIDTDVTAQILGLLGFGGLITLRQGIASKE